MPSQSALITVGGFPVIVPDERYGEAWQRANCFTCPNGMEPGRGSFLMLRGHLNQIDLTGAISVTMQTSGASVAFPGLRLLKAICVTPGPRTSLSAAYLVELVDIRHVLKWSAANKQYNVRCPAPPATSGASLYHAESLNSGSLYTWSTLCESLWGLLPSVAGAFPGLPYSPDGTPENWKFIGVSAWDALGEVLAKLGCEIVYDPVAGSLSIVDGSATQAGLAAIEASYQFNLNDAEPLEANGTKVPATIRVCFHIVYKDYGTEPETPRTGNWSQTPIHTEDVATGVSGAISGTVKVLWDDLPALAQFDGTITNTSALSTRASEVASKWLAGQQSSRSRIIYQGIAPEFRCGSEVSKILWRDLGDGLVTEVHKSPDRQECGERTYENTAPPDLARKSHPLYPKLMQTLKIVGTAGNAISPSTGRIWDAKLQRFDPSAGTWTDGEDVWVWVIDYESPEKLTGGERLLGRLCGSYDNSGVRPLYLVHSGGDGIWELGVTDSSISKGGSGTVSIYGGDTCGSESDTGINVTACSLFGAVGSGKSVGVTWNKRCGRWFLTEEDCDGA